MTNVKIDIENYEFIQDNVIFVDGLILDRVKYKYSWLLNAKIKNAIIGEDSYGLVWYKGIWECGVWEDGTWYSGTFSGGTWENGNFYSYLLYDYDIYDGKFIIKDTNNSYSNFENGVWVNGNFYDGTFGLNNNLDWTGYEYFNGNTISGYPVYRLYTGDTYIDMNIATWMDGIFHNGVMYDSLWINGTVKYATIYNSQWIDGQFFSGQFIGNTWHNGKLYGGDFVKGTWTTGIFSQIGDVPSRFGFTQNTAATYECMWMDGIWENGSFYSGYNLDGYGNIEQSTNHENTIWYNGTWINGDFYGGRFIAGTWYNGNFYDGFFGGLFTTEWYRPQYVGTELNSYSVRLSGLTNWSVESGATENPIYADFGGYPYGTSITTQYRTGTTLNHPTYGWIVSGISMNSMTIGHLIVLQTGGTDGYYTVLSHPTNNIMTISPRIETSGVFCKFILTSTTLNTVSTDILNISGFSFDFNTTADNYQIENIQLKITHRFDRSGDTIGYISASETNLTSGASLTNSSITMYWNTQSDLNEVQTSNFCISNGLSFNRSNTVSLTNPTGMTISTILKTYKAWHPVRLEIYDIQVRLMYKHFIQPTWKNGNWYNGIWDGATWESGNFLKGIWKNGRMTKGNLGS